MSFGVLPFLVDEAQIGQEWTKASTFHVVRRWENQELQRGLRETGLPHQGEEKPVISFLVFRRWLDLSFARALGFLHGDLVHNENDRKTGFLGPWW